MTDSREPADKGPLFRAAWEDQVSDPESRAGILRGVAAMRAALNGKLPLESPEESIEDLAERTAVQRREALAAKAVEATVLPDMLDIEIPAQPALPPRTWEKNQGGAFGGALKRRIETSHIAPSDREGISPADFDAVSYSAIRHELLVARGDRAHSGVLFSAQEFGSLTFSPRLLASRIGGNVIAGTEGRNQDSRIARANQVVSGSLQDRLSKLDDLVATLDTDSAAFKRLGEEMLTPGYAHMKVGDMSSLLSRTEGTIRSMVDAIAMERAVDADRLKGIHAALEYRLGNPDYRQAFDYWKEMTDLSGLWTRRKLRIAKNMRTKVAAEIENRP